MIQILRREDNKPLLQIVRLQDVQIWPALSARSLWTMEEGRVRSYPRRVHTPNPSLVLEPTSSGLQPIQKTSWDPQPRGVEQLLDSWTLRSQLAIVGLLGLQPVSHSNKFHIYIWAESARESLIHSSRSL